VKKIYLMFLLVVVSGTVFGEGESQTQKSFVSHILKRMAQQLVGRLQRDTTRVMNVAILDFATTKNTKEKELGKGMALMITDVLVQQARFNLIEREKIEEINKEIALGQTGLIDEKSAQEAGKLLGAEVMISGSVASLGEYYIIAARAIQVENGKILGTAAEEIRRANMIAFSSKYVQIKKYAIVPALQSALIPGLGQFYNDQPGKGGTLTVCGGISGLTYLLSYFYYQQNLKDYEQPNPNLSLDENNLRAQRLYRKTKQLAFLNQGTLGTSILIWSYAFLDAYFVARKDLKELQQEQGKEEKREGINLDYHGPDLRLTYRVNF